VDERARGRQDSRSFVSIRGLALASMFALGCGADHPSRTAMSESENQHVRAASGIVRAGGDLYIVQDDASFIAVRREDGRVDSIVLPAGPGGRRRFEDALGNKRDKLDLEGVVMIAPGRIAGFGSGSLPARERIAILDLENGEVRVHDASELYRALRERTDFSGSELNLEGAAIAGAALRLFQRGNGAPQRDLSPVNASVDLDRASFVRWLDGEGPLPELARVRRYDLGEENGVRYSFTDAVAVGERILFVAGAEDSPDAIEDGEVVGVRIGVMHGTEVRFAPLLDLDGSRSAAKIEGIAPVREGVVDRFFAVTDLDDPDRPSNLCELALDGPW
jgi:hypothetical protein